MINYEILYQFCKNYTKEYENCEREFEKMENEQYAESLDWGHDGAEPDYTPCEIHKAGLQALIVDDFVQSLKPDLQAIIIMDCMSQKTNNNFRRFKI